MQTTKTSIKLSENEANNMPGRAVVEAILERIEGATIVDTDRSYWQNDAATLVVQIDASDTWRFGEKNVDASLEAMAQLGRLNPDELDSVVRGSKRTYRLWWD